MTGVQTCALPICITRGVQKAYPGKYLLLGTNNDLLIDEIGLLYLPTRYGGCLELVYDQDTTVDIFKEALCNKKIITTSEEWNNNNQRTTYLMDFNSYERNQDINNINKYYHGWIYLKSNKNVNISIKFYQEASSEKEPWSCPWFPYQDNGNYNLYDSIKLNSAPEDGCLIKYDRAFNKRENNGARQCEIDFGHSDLRGNVDNWEGHCDIATKVSIFENKPTTDTVIHTDDGDEIFNEKDKMGLLVALYHYMPNDSNWTSGISDELSPEKWHRIVENMIYFRRQAIGCDIDSSKKVWNYPLYEYLAFYNQESIQSIFDNEVTVIMNTWIKRNMGNESKRYKYKYSYNPETCLPDISKNSNSWIDYRSDSDQDDPDFYRPDSVWTPIALTEELFNDNSRWIDNSGNKVLDYKSVLTIFP